MNSKTGADVVIAGTGIVGCLIAEQMLDAGLSVLMLEAGPRIDRGRIVENYRNMPPAAKAANPDGPFPPKPWALHPMDYTGDPDKDYLITSRPDAKAYQQNYVRYVGGATWHWAGTLWRLTPEDMMLNSKFGVGRDWPFDYSILEPYYVRAEYAIGAAGPSDPALQWPPIRSKPYMMEAFPFGSGQRRCVQAAQSIGLQYIPCAQARNNKLAYQGRPPCSGNNNCMPACPIAAKYDAYSALLRIEAKGGVVAPNAVVYRVETDDKNNVQALHYYDPNKTSMRVIGKTFVLACNGIETPKILLLSKNDKNPNGVANHSDQVGRNMMDTPKMFVQVKFKDPIWSGLGPVQTGAIMSTSQGDFRSRYAGGQISHHNAVGGTAGHSDSGRVRAGSRGACLVGCRRSKKYACRDHRTAQPGDNAGLANPRGLLTSAHPCFQAQLLTSENSSPGAHHRAIFRGRR